jgi:hypothetical protein
MGYGTICGAKIPVARQGTYTHGIHNIGPDTKYVSSCSLCNISRNSTWQNGKYGLHLYMTQFRETEAPVLKFHVCLTYNFHASPKQDELISTETNTTEAYRNQFISLVAVRLRSALKHHATFRITNLNTAFIYTTKLAVTV